MGIYQYEIITKPCLINENMTQVSELIYQTEDVIVWDHSVAKDEGERSALAWKQANIRAYFLDSASSFTA